MRRSGSLFHTPKKQGPVKVKRWRWGKIVWKIYKNTAIVIGSMVLFTTILSVIISSVLLSKIPSQTLPDDMILVFKIEEGITETVQDSSFADPFSFRKPTIRTVTETIHKAKDDDRVRGIVFNVKSGAIALSHIYEVRQAIKDFRQSGKFAYIYSSSYADYSRGMGVYYLASAFDQIWMQPIGMMSMSGIHAEIPYVRDALDIVGANPQFLQREEYKNAMESFTNSKMSEESRESISEILEDFMDVMRLDIARERVIEINTLDFYIDQGIFTGQEALNSGLVDRLDYADIMVSELREEFTGDPDSEDLALVTLQRYNSITKNNVPSGFNFQDDRKTIALVHISGAIMASGRASDGIAAADQITTDITSAAKDEAIEAIVVRIDSPGGSPSASESIRRALLRAQERGKKVIVSMGPTAASGGYWIVTHADTIFTMPTTITGSIGVVMGKIELSELWKKIGLNWDAISYGENADLWSSNKAFNEKGMERLNTIIDTTYNEFLTRVSEGRGMEMDTVREIAKGRAWTGKQAIKNGLADRAGTLNDTLDFVAAELGLESRDNLDIEILPKPKSPFEQIVDLLGNQAAFISFINTYAPVLEKFTPIAKTARRENMGVYDAEIEFLR